VGENQPDNSAGRAVERVTIAEAATLLGCHPNTVRSRVKAGMYRAEKFHTENGPTWMIERDSLTNNAPTSASQQAVSGVPAVQQAALQELARQIVKEAGLVPDPEAEAAKIKAEAESKRKEDLMDAFKRHTQAYLDFLKHMTTLSGASIVAGIAALGAFVKEADPHWPFYISLGVVALAMVMAGFSFGMTSRKVGEGTLKGDFWRDQTLDEFVEDNRVMLSGTRRWTFLITVIWYLGFFSFVLSLQDYLTTGWFF
jgi:hypothetical protein